MIPDPVWARALRDRAQTFGGVRGRPVQYERQNVTTQLFAATLPAVHSADFSMAAPGIKKIATRSPQLSTASRRRQNPNRSRYQPRRPQTPRRHLERQSSKKAPLNATSKLRCLHAPALTRLQRWSSRCLRRTGCSRRVPRIVVGVPQLNESSRLSSLPGRFTTARSKVRRSRTSSRLLRPKPHGNFQGAWTRRGCG